MSGDERAGPVDVGVVGVGKMGSHHARVYGELTDANLVGVNDVDPERAAAVAGSYGTRPLDRDELLAAADAVSVAVPTEYHYETVRECIERDVDVLVEKPFVDDIEQGRELAERARRAGVTIQVGHVERFNPAVRVLSELVADLDVLAVDVDRLGPPVDRGITDSVVMDLMVHDIDILLSLIDAPVDSLSAVAGGEDHVTAQFQFADGSVAVLTASRVTQQKVRRLSLTATQCRVNVDFIDQSVEVHRQSLPEYVEIDGDVRYRHESVVEKPMVANGEPLKNQLESFVESVREGTEPLVTPTEALEVLELARRIERLALSPETDPERVSSR